MLAGNASSAKEVQSFVLDAFTNEVERLTEDILPIFMSSSPDRPKVRLDLHSCCQYLNVIPQSTLVRCGISACMRR